MIHKEDRPHIIINSAMSADGKISTRDRRQTRISGENDFKRVDRLRARMDAVMVGIGTVLADDPSLTVKSPELRSDRMQRCGCEHPVRIVVDSFARTPTDSDIFNKGTGERIIAVCAQAPKDAVQKLQQKAMIITVGEDKVDLPQLMGRLKQMGIRTLMVEGGSTLNWSLISQGLVDEVITFVGPMFIGGESAPTLVDGAGFSDNAPQLELISIERMDGGALLHWRIVTEVHKNS